MASKKHRSLHKRKQKARKGTTLSPKRLHQLEEAVDLMRRHRWVEAREFLEAFDRRYPSQEEVLRPLLNVYHHLLDYKRYQATCERLLQLNPNDPDVTLLLAGAFLKNVRPVLALRKFQRFLERWPEHPLAQEARQTVADLEAKLGEFLANAGFAGPDSRELVALHEEMQSLLDVGKYAQARQVGEKLLQRQPDFAPALNNIGETYFREANYAQAVAYAQRVLAFAPDNFHALSNLTRYLFLSGRQAEAQSWAERLKALRSQAADVWVKKAEALSYLGDYPGILDTLHGKEQSENHVAPPDDAYLYHLAAVAAYRLGQEDEARRLWQESLRLLPGFDLAKANLKDLDRPVAEHHAPWPIPLANWVPPKIIDELSDYLKPVARPGQDRAVMRETRRFLQTYPQVAALVPALLDRGDPDGRAFALRLALMAETPELLAALRDFVLGQRGPDAMRMEAAQAVSRAGLLPSGPIRMWLGGEWRESLLLGFELHGEPVRKHSRPVEDLGSKAMAALHANDGKTGERLLKQALEKEPDAPDLLNNLAQAYILQHRLAEADALVRDIHERFPDYLFGRTHMAQQYIRDGKLDQAKAMLEPLLTRHRLHFTEFAALAVAHIELLLAQGNRDGARSWLDLWEQADPDHPGISQMRRRMKPGLWQGLLGR
jgi:tetratricopeptide (TPR) repeat protein